VKVKDESEAGIEPGGSRIYQMFASLGTYNFRLYWCGQLVSQVGTWMQIIGISWLVLQLTHSPIALGLTQALQFTPVLVISLFAGVVVDRFPKHRLLLVTQSVALVQAFALAILVASGHVQLWEIYVLGIILGCFSAFDTPSRQALTMELVGRDKVVNAVGLNSAQFNSARLLGPAIGGLIIARWGVAACFYINAFSFVASLISLALLRPKEFHSLTQRRAGGRMLPELAEGVRFLRSAPQLMIVIVLLIGLGGFAYNTSTIIPLIAQDALHVGATGFGLLVSAVGLGSLVGALGMAWRGRASLPIAVRSAAACGSIFLAVAFAPWFGLTLGLLLLLGIGLQTFSTAANTLMQLGSPDRLRGRVMSVFTMLTTGLTPVGSIVLGVLAEAVGIRLTVAVEAGVCLVSVGVVLVYRERMQASASRVDAPLPATAPHL